MHKCYICHTENIKNVCFDLFYCPKCMIFRRIPSTPREIIRQACKDFLLSACWNPDSLNSRMKDAEFQLDLLSNYIETGCLYDVGAASGFFMKAASERGWNVRGNDISLEATKWAKENYNLDIFYGFFDEDKIIPNSFDAIVMWNTLEHLDDPQKALDLSYEYLKDGGVIFIKVPEKSIDLPEDVEARYEQHHLTEFSRDGLINMLADCGFVLEHEENDHECGKHIMVVGRV